LGDAEVVTGVTLFPRVLMLAACGPLWLPSGLCLCQPDAGLTTHSPKPVAKSCSHGHCHKSDPTKPTPPQPKKHKPGCVSDLAGVDRSQRTEPAVSTAVIPPLGSPIDMLAFVPVPRPTLNEPPSHVPSTPVYLSHCALVI